MENTDKAELLRLKEIVEWQISFAKDRDIRNARELQLKEINEKLKQYENKL